MGTLVGGAISAGEGGPPLTRADVVRLAVFAQRRPQPPGSYWDRCAANVGNRSNTCNPHPSRNPFWKAADSSPGTPSRDTPLLVPCSNPAPRNTPQSSRPPGRRRRRCRPPAPPRNVGEDQESGYSQMVGRRPVFEARQDRRQRSRSGSRAPVLRLALPRLVLPGFLSVNARPPPDTRRLGCRHPPSGDGWAERATGSN